MMELMSYVVGVLRPLHGEEPKRTLFAALFRRHLARWPAMSVVFRTRGDRWSPKRTALGCDEPTRSEGGYPPSPLCGGVALAG